jgi:DNA-binding LacI/PurR family transcriptional regulator
MFHNSRKTIGVFLERSASEFQNRLCQGIITGAKELGYNVAVFSDYGNYGQNHRYFIGDQTLWELPPYEELDGVVLALDTMEEIDSREHVIKNIRERCHCPIISIRELLVGANNLLVDNGSCMEGLIDHFVKEHGMKKLCFMTGPKDHWDAQERLLCFKRKMDEYGLSYGEHQIFYGDFWKNKGKEACDWFLAEGEPQPEGIICANDYMATAVASELIRRGYRIPQDIAVSGYDGMRSTLSFTPCITTAMVPFFEMGRRAVHIIDKKQDCPEKVGNVFFDAVLQPRESCGCMASEGQEVMQIRQRMYEMDNISQNREMQFHFMSIHMSECHTLEEVGQKIGRYIYNIEGFKDYCMCLCEGWLEKKSSKALLIKWKCRLLFVIGKISAQRENVLTAEN